MDTKWIELEHEISELVRKDNGATVHFNYNYTDYVIQVYTYNTTHKTPFLLNEIASADTNYMEGDEWECVCLNKVLDDLKKSTRPKDMHPYKVVWKKVSDAKTHTSHFYAVSAKEVMEKFYQGKNEHDYTVSNLELLPDS